MKNTILIPLMTILINSAFSQEIKPVVSSNNKFAFELYQQIDKKEKNTFLSPYSISTALAMTYSGANGTTASEMAKVMHYDADSKKSDEDFKWLIDAINSRNNDDLKMRVANRLFGEAKFNFNSKYIDGVKANFGAPLEKLNFGDKEAARKKINAWVEEQTNNKIMELIKKDVLPDSTKLVLVNAIYFYGDWEHQFDTNYTRKGNFYTDETNKIEHKLMWQKDYFEYMETKDFQALRMPYKGNTMYMEIYLPTKKEGIKNLEKEFTNDNHTSWQKSFKREQVYVTFPKFKMTCEFSLGDNLVAMGMGTAFSDAADFLKMVEKPKDALKISKVIHKAFIDVGEKGTEAAAATAVIMITTTSVAYREPDPYKVFTADHPFLFMIKDKETGSILFMGRVMNPGE